MAHGNAPILAFVNYRRTPDIKFDVDYYVNKHLPLVEKAFKQYGFVSWAVVQFPEDDPSGIHIQTVIRFSNAQGAKDAQAHPPQEIIDDLKNYTNATPERSGGWVVKEGKVE